MKAQNFNYLQKVVEQPRLPYNFANYFGHSISIDGNFAVVGAPSSGNMSHISYGGAAFIYEKVRNEDSLYVLNGNSQHLAQISILQDSIAAKTTADNTIWTNIQNTRNNTATILDIDNSNILVSAIFEENEKKVNEVYLNTIAKRNFDYSASHLSLLESVASQCPWEGGNAVFRARGMLALVQRVIINDESMCNAAKSYSNEEDKHVIEEFIVENEYIKLYPNPAQNYITIELQSKIDAKIESVEIFNISGQGLKYYNNISTEQLFQIELESLSEGMYICRIILSDNSIQTVKFSVVK